ncbi:MAG: TIGR00725 family protein [Spirochaetota bacterium]|nr:TIGR00725 family protein [Spirochaetota bacterium]
MPRKVQVVVIGKNNANAEEKEIAYETGKIIGESGAILITGGKLGVMKHVSRGAQEMGGLVLAILPDSDFEASNTFSDIVIPTGMGYARNLINVLSGDLVVAIGGGSGTLSEIAYAWQYKKTIFAYTCVKGWSAIVAEQRKLDDKHNNKIIAIESIDDFERQYLNWHNKFIQSQC